MFVEHRCIDFGMAERRVLFTHPLPGICASERVEFRYGETVEPTGVSGCEFSSVRTSTGRVDADVCVVARGTGHS